MSYDKRFIILCLPSCCYYLGNENSMLQSLQWSNRQQTFPQKKRKVNSTFALRNFPFFSVDNFIENGPVFMGALI